MWKSHAVYLNYAADGNGTVQNTKTGRILQGTLNGYGYLKVKPCVGSKRYEIGKHRFVYECFYGCLPSDMHVDHIDGNKTNCCLDNLQALTQQAHMKKTAKQNPGMASKRAQAHAKMVMRTKHGESQTFVSIREAADCTHRGNRAHIIDCLKNRRQYHAGYTWTYVQDKEDTSEVWVCLRAAKYGKLEVSDKGRYKNRHGAVKKGNRHGAYYKVTVKGKHMPVHHLICTAFHGERKLLSDSVDHISRDKSDNCATNLRWASKSEQASNMKTNRAVRAMDPDTLKVIGQWSTIAAAAIHTGAHQTTIGQACSGSIKTCVKLKWEYIE